MQVTGLVSGDGGRVLIICHWFVIEFWRHQVAGNVSRRCFSAWLQAELGAKDEHRALRQPGAVVIAGKIRRSVDIGLVSAENLVHVMQPADIR